MQERWQEKDRVGESLTALELHYKYALLKQLTRHYLNVSPVCMYVCMCLELHWNETSMPFVILPHICLILRMTNSPKFD